MEDLSLAASPIVFKTTPFECCSFRGWVEVRILWNLVLHVLIQTECSRVEEVKDNSIVLVQGQEATSGDGLLVDWYSPNTVGMEEREGSPSVCACLPVCFWNIVSVCSPGLPWTPCPLPSLLCWQEHGGHHVQLHLLFLTFHSPGMLLSYCKWNWAQKMIGFPRSDCLDDEAVKATLLVAQAQDVLLAAWRGEKKLIHLYGKERSLAIK